MGIFRRKSSESPGNPGMAELGREFAIAKRHGDRKAMRRIGREYYGTAKGETDAASFQAGQDSYNAIPPVKSPRRGRRR